MSLTLLSTNPDLRNYRIPHQHQISGDDFDSCQTVSRKKVSIAPFKDGIRAW